MVTSYPSLLCAGRVTIEREIHSVRQGKRVRDKPLNSRQNTDNHVRTLGASHAMICRGDCAPGKRNRHQASSGLSVCWRRRQCHSLSREKHRRSELGATPPLETRKVSSKGDAQPVEPGLRVPRTDSPGSPAPQRCPVAGASSTGSGKEMSGQWRPPRRTR